MVAARIVAVLICVGVLIVPSVGQANAAQAHRASRACQFKHAAWSVVQDTSQLIYDANVYVPADVQNEANALQERYDRLEAKYSYPNGSLTLFGALVDAWMYAESASQDTQAAYDGDFDYWQQQKESDLGSAWEAEDNAWYDVKAICWGG